MEPTCAYPRPLVSTHRFPLSLGRVEAEERGFGEGETCGIRWTILSAVPPRVVASSFATLPREGDSFTSDLRKNPPSGRVGREERVAGEGRSVWGDRGATGKGTESNDEQTNLKRT